MFRDLTKYAVEIPPVEFPASIARVLSRFFEYPGFELLPVRCNEGVKAILFNDCIPLIIGCRNGQSCRTPLTEAILKGIIRLDLKSSGHEAMDNLKRALDNECSAMVVMGDLYIGMVSFRHIIAFLKDHEVKEAIMTSPLTGLPGNYSIRKEFVLRDKEKPVHVCYFDLNDFKAYNDKYGIGKGDEVIKYVSVLLKELCPGDFVGHVGGDDFVVFIKNGEPENKLSRITNRFDREVRAFYNEMDAAQGYITSTDRHGKVCIFPLMKLAVAVKLVAGEAGFEDVTRSLASLKKLAKEQSRSKGESCYVFDRRETPCVA